MAVSITGNTNITMTTGATVSATNYINIFSGYIDNYTANSRTVIRKGVSFNGTTGVVIDNELVYDGYIISIASDTTNYNVRAALATAGWNGSGAVKATIIVNSGVTVYSSSTGTYAFLTGTSYPSGSSLQIINKGTIVGRGGAGASGTTSTGGSGSAGGPAIYLQVATTIYNQGTIAGGGGGGGAGDGYAYSDESGYYSVPGGSGGGGAPYGQGGSGATNATLTTPGSSSYGGSGAGGNGGAWGSSGSSSQNGRSGGSAGNAIAGSAFLTLQNSLSGRVIGNIVT